MIYVDKLRKAKWKFKESCHLFSDEDTSSGLHKMARSISLSRRHFQDSEHFPHYDLTKGKREQAVLKGATEVSNKFAVHIRAMERSSHEILDKTKGLSFAT